MVYLEAYFLIAIIATVIIFLLGIFNKRKDVAKEYFSLISGSFALGFGWPLVAIVMLISSVGSYLETKRNLKKSNELSELFVRDKEISDKYIYNNKELFNKENNHNLRLAYADVFPLRYNSITKEKYKVEYINDLSKAIEKSLNDNTPLLKALESIGLDRPTSRIKLRKSLGEGSHVSYVKPNTRLVITQYFADSLRKIKTQEDFEMLSDAILTANDYLCDSWLPNKEPPNLFELHGLLLVTNFTDDLKLFILTTAETNRLYSDAYLLLITEQQ